MSEDQKPWYWGVKWRNCADGDDVGWSLDYDGESSCVDIFHEEQFIASVGVDSAFGKYEILDRHVALIAAAPETATERDQLKARVRDLEAALREVLSTFKDGVGGQ